MMPTMLFDGGEGEKAGDGSGGPWHSFESMPGTATSTREAREERRVERRYLPRPRIKPPSRGTSTMQP